MSDALSEEFFAEVGDKYYPQVLEGLERLGAGDVAQGIEILARPLHTIKGVTGFMPGFESASSFTHKVESFLKKLSAGSLPHSADNIALASYGVNSVFAVIEQIRDQGAPDQAEMDAVCAALAAAAEGAQATAPRSAAADCLRVQEDGAGMLVRVTAARMHTKDQAEALLKAVMGLPQTRPVILDLCAVKSFGSGVWEDLCALSGMWDIRVRGLSGAVRETYYAWNFDAAMPPEGSEPQGGRA